MPLAASWQRFRRGWWTSSGLGFFGRQLLSQAGGWSQLDWLGESSGSFPASGREACERDCRGCSRGLVTIRFQAFPSRAGGAQHHRSLSTACICPACNWIKRNETWVSLTLSVICQLWRTDPSVRAGQVDAGCAGGSGRYSQRHFSLACGRTLERLKTCLFIRGSSVIICLRCCSTNANEGQFAQIGPNISITVGWKFLYKPSQSLVDEF